MRSMKYVLFIGKNDFYDGLNLELGLEEKKTAKPVLSPNADISEN